MSYLLPTFQSVSVIFAISAVVTGVQAIVDPIGFSKFFGLHVQDQPLSAKPATTTNTITDSSKCISNDVNNNYNTNDTTPSPPRSQSKISHLEHDQTLTLSYISLMGVRQLGTGMILLTFAYQRKWTESATILAIIGIVVAGTDGIYIARGGGTNARQNGIFHAIPGALIAGLAGTVLLREY